MTFYFPMDIEERLRNLEQENIGTSNELYRLENMLDVLAIRIQNLEKIISEEQVEDQF